MRNPVLRRSGMRRCGTICYVAECGICDVAEFCFATLRTAFRNVARKLCQTRNNSRSGMGSGAGVRSMGRAGMSKTRINSHRLRFLDLSLFLIFSRSIILMSTVQLPSDGPSPTTLAAPAGREVPAATQPAASEIGSQVDDAERAIRPANRRATVGSTAVDEAKRVAIEVMNRVGAMKSTSSGQGYYECVSPQCPAKCRNKKEKR